MAATIQKGLKDGGPTNPEIQDDAPKDFDEEKDAKSTASTKTGTKKAPIRRFLQNHEVAEDAEPQERPQRCIEDLRRQLRDQVIILRNHVQRFSEEKKERQH